MRRPGLWVTNGHPGDPTLMLSWRPAALTCFYDYLGVNGVFGYKAANPDVPIIVRFQHPINWQKDPAGYARFLGEQVASKWNDMKVLDPYVYFANEMNLYYENGDLRPSNQPNYTTPEFYQKYAQWVRMTADIVKSRVPEMKLVTPPFAFGHHEDGSPDDNGQPLEGWAGYDYLYETVRDYFNSIICFHSYWGHAGGSQHAWLYDPVLSSWYAFRWRRVLKLFETRYKLKAKILIDEAGNFGASDPDFTDQIIYHAQQCLSDARVIAVAYFLWFDPTNSPGNIPNSWVQRVANLSDHLSRLKNMPEVPITPGSEVEPGEETPGAPTIRVLFNDGTVKVMLLEEYLRAVVPAEMPALWPAEAVKAQAVASRSYAQYAIEHPRHPNADICTSPAHCQNFDLARVHPRSDEAIQLTKNIIARYNGQTVNGIFSANCGGHTLNNEDVFKSTPVPYLRGVPCPDKGEKRGHGVGLCQYGARAFAAQGQPYEAIIKHYYTGVTLGLITPAVQIGAIVGLITDHTGQPTGQVRVVLTGAGQTAETRSLPNGRYGFSNVPAGTYTLEVPDYGIRQTNLTVAGGQQLIVNLTLPAPTQPPIIVHAVRGPGLPLLVGNWIQPNVPIRITPPGGPSVVVVSGSKPEYGPGGFEIYANKTGMYVLEVAGYRFEIPMNGQYTRLVFRPVEPVQATGIIEGRLLDYLNRPVPNWFVQLTGNGLNLTATTQAQGYFTFANLAAGSYVITVADSDISQTVANNGQEKVTLTLQLPAPPGSGWQVDLSQGTGLPLLVGDIGVANAAITISSPSGRRQQVTSGSKPEWGIGGFEIYATELGNYSVEFFGQRFTIPVQGQFTKAIFRKEDGSAGQQVRLVSMLLPRSRAEALRTELEADVDTRGLFMIQGL
jgi:hypothetical protein